MIIDSHCHLSMSEFKSDLDLVVNNAKKSNVEGMLTICTKLDELKEIRKISKKYNLWYSAGIHPCNIKKNDKICLNYIKEHSNEDNFIGIGETGLDFYYTNATKEEQINSFNQHIELSRELDRPIIIHTRDADKETIKIIKEQYSKKPFKGVIHCFTGTKELAEEAISIGLLISISGIITFKNASNLREIIKYVPIESLLIETDAPYLAPVPYRGKRNEPSFVKYTAHHLANLKNISYAKCIEYTNKNFYNLFSKAKAIL